MREDDLFDEDSSATLFRDVIMLALAGFVTLVMLLLPHINPKAVAEDTSKSPGNMTVELRCCLLYTSPSPRDATLSRMPSSA